MGTEDFFLGPELHLTTHFHQVPRLKIGITILPLPPHYGMKLKHRDNLAFLIIPSSLSMMSYIYSAWIYRHTSVYPKVSGLSHNEI
jgi:hypothetical protein